MNWKHQQSICDANINLNLMRENVIQVNRGITINVGVSVKNITYVKKIIFTFRLHVIVKMENNSQVLLMIR